VTAANQGCEQLKYGEKIGNFFSMLHHKIVVNVIRVVQASTQETTLGTFLVRIFYFGKIY
jgi:hypothetical protein